MKIRIWRSICMNRFRTVVWMITFFIFSSLFLNGLIISDVLGQAKSEIQVLHRRRCHIVK